MCGSAATVVIQTFHIGVLGAPLAATAIVVIAMLRKYKHDDKYASLNVRIFETI